MKKKTVIIIIFLSPSSLPADGEGDRHVQDQQGVLVRIRAEGERPSIVAGPPQRRRRDDQN